MNDMEKNQVSESEDFAAMLEETMVKFRPGQVVKGVVAQVSDDGVVVSIPGKADGFIKKNDLVTTDCKVDDEIEAEVVKLNDGEGYVLLSERKVMATKNWEKLVAEYDEGAYVEAYDQQYQGRNRKYYTITDRGIAYQKELLKEWEEYKAIIDDIITGGISNDEK